MYTIKQAAARSGVGISLLRAWERRYGIVSPSRTAGGYRLYDDAAITRLRAMRRLIDAGWSASQAANEVLTAPEAVAEPGASSGTPVRGIDVPADIESLVIAADAYDTVAVEAALDDLFARGSYEAVIDDLVLPAVAALGTAWADGRIDVAAEHLASAAVQRRLAALFDLAGAPGAGRLVAVGLPPGCRHEIGTIAFAVALRRRGVNVLYLGPDVPLTSWVHVIAEPTVEAAVVGIARPADVAPGREVAEAIAVARPSLLLAVGGPSAEAVAESQAHVLAARVADAASELAGLMAAR